MGVRSDKGLSFNARVLRADRGLPPVATTILNPFTVGGAISAADGRGFFGRDRIFAFVGSALNSERRPPILLFGQRRIGKSSVLRQLAYHLPAQWRTVYYDLQGKGQMSLDGVLYGLARAIADSLGMTRPDRDDATEQTFDRYLEGAIAGALGNPRYLVLMFDEFDVVDEPTEEAASNRFIPYLTELIARHPEVGYVLVVGRKTEELSSAVNGLLLKDAVQHVIGRLAKDEVVELVERSTVNGISFTPEAVERVFELAAGHPFCTQVLCRVAWDRAMDTGLHEAVSVGDVDAAVSDALRLGALGMNWIFDGLEDACSRVVLAALAQESGEFGTLAAQRSGIENVLRQHNAVVDPLRLDSALRDLQSWDVIERVGDGYRFCVSLIASWIQRERPLARLDREIRLANPRAWKLYELALQSKAADDIDGAIKEFRDALESYPAFVEAQRGLASALLQRGLPSQMTETIEAFERVMDLDPAGSPAGLLEALSRGLETTSNVELVKRRSARIRELDPGGQFETRALRVLVERGHKLLSARGDAGAKDAAELFAAAGNAALAEKCRHAWKRYDRMLSLAGGVLMLSILGIVFASAIASGVQLTWLRITLGALGGTCLALSAHLGDPARAGRLWRIPVGVFASFVIAGLGMYLFSASDWWALAGYIVPLAVVAGTTSAEGLTALPEDAPIAPELSMVDRLQKAVIYVLRGRLPEQR